MAEYNALHDPHLKQYFKKKVWKKPIVDQGLATPDGKVVASDRRQDWAKFTDTQRAERVSCALEVNLRIIPEASFPSYC